VTRDVTARDLAVTSPRDLGIRSEEVIMSGGRNRPGDGGGMTAAQDEGAVTSFQIGDVTCDVR